MQREGVSARELPFDADAVTIATVTEDKPLLEIPGTETLTRTTIQYRGVALASFEQCVKGHVSGTCGRKVSVALAPDKRAANVRQWDFVDESGYSEDWNISTQTINVLARACELGLSARQSAATALMDNSTDRAAHSREEG